MAIEIKRGAHLSVPQALARNLRVNAGGNHLRRMAVTQIMETNVRPLSSLQEHREGMTDAVGLQSGTVSLYDDVVIRHQPDADLQQRLRLLQAMAAQFLDHCR